MTFSPAAVDTLLAFFRDINTTPADYDFIASGDLGAEGSALLRALTAREGR